MNERNEISHLLNAVNLKVGAIRYAKKTFSAQLAPEFNIFNFLRSDETGLSRIIADLLDREGTHGQGKVFLDIFSKRLAEDFPWTSSANNWAVNTEKQANGRRRIDICLESENGIIGIENKPWAIDQQNQLSDYARYLKNNSGSKHWLLIYISNTPPSEKSIGKDELSELEQSKNLVVLDYGFIKDWLEECASKSKSLTVRVFIENLISYLLTSVNKDIDMKEETEVLNEIKKSPDRISAAFSVYRSLPHLKCDLLEHLRQSLGKLLDGNGFHLVWDDKLGKSEARYIGFGVNKVDNQDKYLRFEFDLTGLNRLYFGIRKRDDSAKEEDNIWSSINKIMTDSFGSGKRSDWWPWWSYNHNLGHGYDNWGTSETPWIDIVEGKLQDKILDIAKSIYKEFVGKLDLLQAK